MALPGEGERQRAAQALAALAGPLAERALLSPLELELEGLSHFRNRVRGGWCKGGRRGAGGGGGRSCSPSTLWRRCAAGAQRGWHGSADL